MEKTPAEVRALKDELQVWMGRNGLDEEIVWKTPEGVYGENHATHIHPCYLVLCTEGDLYSVLWGEPPDYPTDRSFPQLKEEFKSILAGHGCWYEWENHTTLCILDRKERVKAAGRV